MGLSFPRRSEWAKRPDLVDRAVCELNGIDVAKGLDMAKVVGEYLLKAFFDGNPKPSREKSAKHVSFRKLAERDDLHVTHGFLWHSVAYLDQLHLLPKDVAVVLPFSHHKLLLPVKDEKAKVALAQKAAKDGWSKRELEVQVRKERARKGNGQERRGRRPLPALVKALAFLTQAAEAARSEDLGTADLDHYPREKVERAVAEAERHLELLHDCVSKVRAQLARGKVEAGGGHGCI